MKLPVVRLRFAKDWCWYIPDDDGDRNVVLLGLTNTHVTNYGSPIRMVNLVIGPVLLAVAWSVKR